ncbi:MAG: glutamate-5-semialdehyde dehydrogenase [Acidobacteriota bacterium]
MIVEIAKRAKAAAGAMARLSAEEKNHALTGIARSLDERREEILAANRKDLDAARAQVESGKMAESLYSRLKLDDSKLDAILSGIEQIARMEDPVGRVTLATELDEGLRLYRVTCPVGVVGVIFESRPDALVQIASLCLKSGNAVLLKGGREAEKSNRALFRIIHASAAERGLPGDAMALLERREDVMALLDAESFVDLIVPRGSNSLVRFIQENTRIPVLGHAEGICHIYIDRAADLTKAVEIILDAKVSYPAACNAVETLLIHSRVAPDFLPRVAEALKKCKVELRCDPRSIELVEGAKEATEVDWATEYCDLILSIKVVDSLEEAIAHINLYGSHHTDAIITEDDEAWEKFFVEVDSAGVYRNASTRFADGYRYGFGAELGISTGKLHPRGPVGLDGLVTYKYKLTGRGHTAAMYSKGGRRFTHKNVQSTDFSRQA